MGLDITNGSNGANDSNGVVVDKAVAIAPNNLDAVPGLVKQINAGVDALSTGGDEARHALLVKARNLMQALETPRETMIKHCWAQVGTSNAFQPHPETHFQQTDLRSGFLDRCNGWVDHRR